MLISITCLQSKIVNYIVMFVTFVYTIHIVHKWIKCNICHDKKTWTYQIKLTSSYYQCSLYINISHDRNKLLRDEFF